MKSYTQLAGDSKAANRRLPWHKRAHGKAYEATVGLTLEERGALCAITDLFHLYGAHVADDDGWWSHALHISHRKWRAVRNALIRAQMISVQDGFVLPVQFGDDRPMMSPNIPKNPMISRTRASHVSPLSFQEEEVSSRSPTRAHTRTHTHASPPRHRSVDELLADFDGVPQ